MAARSARMPMPGGEDLDQDPVLKANNFGVENTVRAIREDFSAGLKMVDMLHSMSRGAVESIIRGTVAFDTVAGSTRWNSVTVVLSIKARSVILTSGPSLTLSLVKEGPANAEAYVGFCLSVPRHPDTSVWAWYSSSIDVTPSRRLEITLKFPNNHFTMSHRHLDVSESENLERVWAPQMATAFSVVSVNLTTNPTVAGFGLPFHGENETVDAWINKDEPICGAIKLTQLLQQKSRFLVKATGDQVDEFFAVTASHHKPFHYGYGDHQQIPRNRGLAFLPKIRYDDFNQRDTALTQMHVQDVWDFHAALEEIETMDIPAFPRHWRAARRALKGDFTPILVEFDADKDKDKLVIPRSALDDHHRPRSPVTWNAVHLSYGSDLMRRVDLKDRIAIGLMRPASGNDRKYSPDASKDYTSTLEETSRTPVRLLCQSGIGNEKKRIEAVNRVSSLDVWPAVMKQDMFAERKMAALNDILVGQGLWDLFKATSSFRLPHFDVFDGVIAEVRDACLEHVFEDDRKRAREYFGKLHFGIGLVSAAPGMGKSHLASIIVTLLCLNPSIRKLYVSAASNGATDNILDRINKIAESIVDKLIVDKLIVDKLIIAGQPIKRLMLLRGYNVKIEIENCFKALSGAPFEESGIWNTSPWHFERSLCWWTLRALGSENVPPLTSNDCAELWDLHQGLSALVPPDERSPNEKASDTDTKLSRFIFLVRFARGLITCREYTQLQSKETHEKSLACLMGLVVSCANVVATTPAASSYYPYLTFNSEMARAVVFDEAGTMFRADGLLVFGNTPRLMIAVGDPKQLAPALATAIERLDFRGPRDERLRRLDDDRHLWPTNRFVAEAEVSWLAWFIHLGFPVFHLHIQHRMAKGLFDLMLETSYNHISVHFKYSPLCRPIDFPLGIKVEQYMQAKHQLPSQSPDKLLPIFFNTLYCPCRNYPDSASRLNPRQADCIAKCLEAMMKEPSISPADVAVLTPYRANFRALQKRFRKDEVLEQVACSTIDTFQGRETQIVVLALCVTAETGPSFAADARRLNVALTRHKSSLFIFGAIDTMKNQSFMDRHSPLFKKEKERNTPDTTTLSNVFQIIKGNRRIVQLKGDWSVDPDGYWKRLETSSKFL
ncbi:hypothetical protein ACHAPT_013610 [Fusarium lateritium]